MRTESPVAEQALPEACWRAAGATTEYLVTSLPVSFTQIVRSTQHVDDQYFLCLVRHLSG